MVVRRGDDRQIQAVSDVEDVVLITLQRIDAARSSIGQLDGDEPRDAVELAARDCMDAAGNREDEKRCVSACRGARVASGIDPVTFRVHGERRVDVHDDYMLVPVARLERGEEYGLSAAVSGIGAQRFGCASETLVISDVRGAEARPCMPVAVSGYRERFPRVPRMIGVTVKVDGDV